MRIRDAQKHMDPTEPDLQHCELDGGDAFVGIETLQPSPLVPRPTAAIITAILQLRHKKPCRHPVGRR